MLWENFNNIEPTKQTIKFIYDNLKLFLKIFWWDFELFLILCVSIFIINKSNTFFQVNKKIKFLFSGHNDLMPVEILVSAKINKVISITAEDRIITSNWSSRSLFDYFFVSGPKSKNNLIKKKYNENSTIYKNAFLMKSKKIKKLKKKNQDKNLNCLVIDYHTDLNWYTNGTNTVNNKRLNNSFYEIVLSLAENFKDINFLIKSKKYDWLKDPFFSKIINKFNTTNNIKILDDIEKWSPEYSASYCDFAFGLHSSLLDEIFAAGKPIIVFDRDEYPSKIFDYGEKLLAKNFIEIQNKFYELEKNFDKYNKDLDIDRSFLFYNINMANYKNDLNNILKNHE